MKCLLDSNFLMITGKYRVDVFSELRSEFGRPDFCTLDMVIEELRKISRGSGRNAPYARLALQLIKKNGVRVLKSENTKCTDSEILNTALKTGAAVCTQDKALIKRLKGKGIKCIFMLERNKKIACCNIFK